MPPGQSTNRHVHSEPRNELTLIRFAHDLVARYNKPAQYADHFQIPLVIILEDRA